MKIIPWNKGLRQPLEQRLWSKIEINDNDCWVWVAYKNKCGYGVIGTENHKTKLAHRVSYEIFKSDIPMDLELDHLCRNRACINPDHLEVVTHKENVQRGEVHLINSNKTHCPKGHSYSGDNLYINSENRRCCRTCIRLTGKLWKRSHYKSKKHMN